MNTDLEENWIYTASPLTDKEKIEVALDLLNNLADLSRAGKNTLEKTHRQVEDFITVLNQKVEVVIQQCRECRELFMRKDVVYISDKIGYFCISCLVSGKKFMETVRGTVI